MNLLLWGTRKIKETHSNSKSFSVIIKWLEKYSMDFFGWNLKIKTKSKVKNKNKKRMYVVKILSWLPTSQQH